MPLSTSGGRAYAGVRSVAREGLFLPNFTRGVFGVARSLLILFKDGIGLCFGNAFGLLARLFVDDGECLPSVLSRALRLSVFGPHPVGVLSSRRANLSRCGRFHLSSLPTSGLRAVGRRRCTYLFQLRFLGLGSRLQAFHKTRFFSGHAFNPHFTLAVTSRSAFADHV